MPDSCRCEKADPYQVASSSAIHTAHKRPFKEDPLIEHPIDFLSTGDQSATKRALIQLNYQVNTTPFHPHHPHHHLSRRRLCKKVSSCGFKKLFPNNSNTVSSSSSSSSSSSKQPLNKQLSATQTTKQLSIINTTKQPSTTTTKQPSTTTTTTKQPSNSNFSGSCSKAKDDLRRLGPTAKCLSQSNRSTIDHVSSLSPPAMGHASSKRSRQETGHRGAQMVGNRHHKHYLDGYKESINMRYPGKAMRRSDAEGEEDERVQWGVKTKLGSKEVSSIPRSFGAHQPRFLHASAIKLHKLQFGIDKRLTAVDEKSNAVLKYRTPHFRALATVEIPPLPAGVNIQVGWIQVCTDMQFINTYGNEGLTSWEFPEIVSGKYKMVSDADGKQYPWYGSKNEVAHLQGPTQTPTTATVHMNDNFFPQVTWYIPSIGYTRDPSLTYVYRKQRFYTFLALKDVNTDTYQIIRTLTWSMELAIDVNPKNPLGKRARLLGPFVQESPKVVPEHLTPPLKSYALNPPNANSCQVLVWRPKYGDTEMVVPPVQTTMDMSRYLISTRDSTSKLLRITKSNFLLQQQQEK